MDLIHTFNSVCMLRGIPWAVTFESTVPRTNQTVGRPWEKNGEPFIPDIFTRRSLHLLTDSSCKACIALSDSARRIQDNMLNQMIGDPAFARIIQEKTVVIHPPQDALVDACEIKKKFSTISSCVEFIFVGRNFFCKGGPMLIEAMEKFSEKVNFHLTVVSNLDDKLFSTGEERKKWANILEKTPWITWFKSLPNEKVLHLCKKAHIGCLPTFKDTYGYSVLEMQACGCPVITTNVRALPEINNKNCGWIVPLEIDKIGGEVILYSDKDEEARRTELLLGLERCLEEIFGNLEMVEPKAVHALGRIKKGHSPEEYAKKVSMIYLRK